MVGREGNKQGIANNIISLIPDHNFYIEPFCGMGGVFLNKPRVKYNSLNDIDDFVYDFWNCLLEDKERLIREVNKYPIYSRILKEKGDDFVIPVMVYAGNNKEFAKIVSNISYGDFEIEELSKLLGDIDIELINLIDFDMDIKNALNEDYFNDYKNYTDGYTQKEIYKPTQDKSYNPDYSLAREDKSIVFFSCSNDQSLEIFNFKKIYSDIEICQILIDNLKKQNKKTK